MKQNIQIKTEGRNYGVDALRCVSMLLIVCLHIMNRGGAIPAGGSAEALWLFPLRSLASSAVNIYALISGFVMLTGKFRPARVLELWLEVWVLDMGIALVGDLIHSGAMNENYWVRCLFPFTQKAYWYFTAYVGVYAFSPLINRAIRTLNRIQAVTMVWIMVLLFSLCTTLGYVNQGDPYAISGGYSVLWLLVLYIVGACMRQAELFRRTTTWRLLTALLLVLAGQTLLYGLAYLPNPSTTILALKKRQLDYTFPLITAAAVLMLASFSRLRIGARAQKMIAFLSPLTFGVYIIHVHPVIWIPMKGFFQPLLGLPGALLPFAVLLTGMGLFALCVFVNWLRALLFRLLRVRQFMDRMERSLRKWIYQTVKE